MMRTSSPSSQCETTRSRCRLEYPIVRKRFSSNRVVGIISGGRQGIPEHSRSFLERHPMLPEIHLRLARIGSKAHGADVSHHEGRITTVGSESNVVAMSRAVFWRRSRSPC